MKIRLLLAAAVFLTAIGSLAVPRAAEAAVAYAVGGTTNVRSGPGVRYPVIARVIGGTPVTIVGCLSNRAWCDAIVGSIRGWINARRLEFAYGGRRVLVPSYHHYFGAPVVQFHFGPSWHWRPGGGHGRPRDENGRPRD